MSHACGCATICVYHGELVPKSHIATLTAENERLRFEADEYQRRHRIVRRRAEQAEARTRALEAAIEGNTFCECFDEYGRKRPTPCWRCAALTEPPPPRRSRDE